MKVLHLTGPAPLQTNSFVLLGDTGRALVIDPAPSLAAFEKALEGAPVEAILLTHGHYDHMTGLADLQKRWNCPVYLDPADAAGTPLMPAGPGTLGYTDGGTLELAGLSVTCWHTPGHTAGTAFLKSPIGKLITFSPLTEKLRRKTMMNKGSSFIFNPLFCIYSLNPVYQWTSYLLY